MNCNYNWNNDMELWVNICSKAENIIGFISSEANIYQWYLNGMLATKKMVQIKWLWQKTLAYIFSESEFLIYYRELRKILFQIKQLWTSTIALLNLSTLQLQRRVVTIDGYTDIPQNDEDKLLKAVATQPVSVGICGSARAFQSYSKVSSTSEFAIS